MSLTTALPKNGIRPTYEKDSWAFDEAGSDITQELHSLAHKLTHSQGTVKTREQPRIHFEDKALTYFQDWQRSKEAAALKNKNSIKLAILGRQEVYAVKLGIIFTTAQYDFTNETKIDLAAIKEATRMIDTYFEPYSYQIIEMAKHDELNNLQEKILATLRRLGGNCNQRVLLMHLHVKLKDVSEAIEALIASGEIEIEIELEGQEPHQQTIIRLKDGGENDE